MSIKPPYIIINSELYTKTWKDDMYNSMNSYLYSINKYKSLTDKGRILASIGRSGDTVYYELFYYKTLIEYFINAASTLRRLPPEEYTEAKKQYDFHCIRKTILCRFGTTEIFDKLYMLSGVWADTQDGIDYMILEGTFIVV